MKTGDLVLIIGNISKWFEGEDLRHGTFWTDVSENRVLVLLKDGNIHICPKYEVVKQ